MKKRLKRLSLALGMAAMSASTTHAALVTGFDSINLDPAISNKTDMVGVYSSQNVGRGGWNTGFLLDYAKNPLELGSPPGNRIEGVVDNQLVANFYGTYGIRDWFSVGLNIPVLFWNDVRPWNLQEGNNAAFAPAFDPQINLGDIRFELKFRIRDNSDRLIGIALVPFMTMPSGPSSTFAGNGAITGGAKVVLDFNIHDRVRLALNVGYLNRDRKQILNVDMDDQLLVSIGISIDIIKERLTFIAEGQYDPVIRHIFKFDDIDEVHNPLEVRGALRVRINDNFAITAGGGVGLTIGVGSPDYRAFLGLNYNWVPAACDTCQAPAPTPKAEGGVITIDQTVHFAFNQAVIKPVSYPILNDVSNIIKQNPDKVQRVAIEGHTDAIGSDEYNMRLSDRRANAVKQYLTNQGVPAEKLQAAGFGESRPVDSNETAEGRAKNRRVEFRVNQ